MAGKETVWQALEKVMDPELGKDLVSLGMVKDVKVEGTSALIEVALTTPACPLRSKIKEDVEREVLAADPGLTRVAVTFRGMTDDEKTTLAQKTGHTGWNNPFACTTTRIIAVGSGKGGVGKSTVTVNLAYALNAQGYRVGILDADVYGFSIPGLMGVSGQRPVIRDKSVYPIEREGVKMISIGNFIEGNQPVAWRGPMLSGLLEQFLRDVSWGSLDYLLIDMPPGTGDMALTLMQRLPEAYLVIVTTPQPAALSVAVRLGLLARESKLKNAGVIENMAYFTCENCSHRHYIFGHGEQAVADAAAELGVAVLGHIPFESEIRHGSDMGQPPALIRSPKADAYSEIARRLVEVTGQGRKKPLAH
ncbi:MAG: Mrp/NBP35 family ATP-binding protein [Peptococcaceae bacterium]|nr:Mrp/NBP35 family ATP-binding protein [Peptococcaceae bacterium]